MTAGRLERQIRFAACSAGFNILIAAAKLALGLFGASLLLCLYAFCNAGMATAKLAAVRSHRMYNKARQSGEADPMDEKSTDEEEWLCYLHMGLITGGSSLIFLLYSIAVWHFDHTPAYSLNAALLIAAVSFTEIGVAVFGMFVAGKAKKPLVTAIKLTNLAFSLFTLALTQTALLSVAQERDMSTYNGLIGVLLGGVSLLIGLGMALRASYALRSADVEEESNREGRGETASVTHAVFAGHPSEALSVELSHTVEEGA